MAKKEASMIDWAGLSHDMESLLRLKASPVAYKRLEKLEELDKIPEVMRLDRRATFCQLPAMVRTMGWTVAATRDNFGERCARITGLAPTTEKEVAWEAEGFAHGWFANVEEARKQMAAYPLVPPGEAVVLGVRVPLPQQGKSPTAPSRRRARPVSPNPSSRSCRQLRRRQSVSPR